jgi:ABC-type Fe3+ transport system permease subunit
MAKKQKVSAKQAEARRQAALERERRQAEAKARKEFWKRVGIVVVCVILVLALSIPTVGLMVLGGTS